MAIIVREVSDDDLPRTCEIEGTAFADNPLSSVLFPGPFAPEGDQKRVADLIEQRKADPKMKYIQAYDEETKQLIAFSKWNIYDTTEAATAKRPSRNFGPGSNAPACEAFFGGLAKKKEEIMGGKPHICKTKRKTGPFRLLLYTDHDQTYISWLQTQHFKAREQEVYC